MKIHAKFSIVILSLAVALGSYSCAPTKINGGGTLPSTSPNAKDKANFGFEGNSCTPGIVTGSFNYHDKRAPGWPNGGVKLNGSVIEAAKCSEWDLSTNPGIACGICNLQFCACENWPDDWESCVFGFLADPEGYCQGIENEIPDNLYGVSFWFESTNPRYRGTGTGVACMTDNGQGSKATDDDKLVIIIGPGQYEGYINQGSIKGNIGSEPCCHDLCLAGFPLDDPCDPCVAQVCAADSSCCDTAWDQGCIELAQNTCGLACD